MAYKPLEDERQQQGCSGGHEHKDQHEDDVASSTRLNFLQIGFETDRANRFPIQQNRFAIGEAVGSEIAALLWRLGGKAYPAGAIAMVRSKKYLVGSIDAGGHNVGLGVQCLKHEPGAVGIVISEGCGAVRAGDVREGV